MKIIRGEFVRKSLREPASILTRPTSDKVRQAVFNVIEHHTEMAELQDSTVLDAFAGTGSLGLEALSRGAKHVCFVDNQKVACRNIQRLLELWGAENRATVLNQDIQTIRTAERPVDFIFCDPPYGKDLVNIGVNHLYHHGWIDPNTTIIAEMYKNDTLQIHPDFTVLQDKKYGDTRVVFFKISP